MEHLSSLHRIEANKKHVTYLNKEGWQQNLEYYIKEFNLIKEKKSQLSRKQREEIYTAVSHLIDIKVVKVIDEKKLKNIERYNQQKPHILKWQKENKDVINQKRRERQKNKYSKLLVEIKNEIIKADITRQDEKCIPITLFVFMYKTGIRSIGSLSKHTGYAESEIDETINRWREAGIMNGKNVVLETPFYCETGLIINACLIGLVGGGQAVARVDEQKQGFVFAADKESLGKKKQNYESIKDADISIKLKHCIADYFQVDLGTLYKYTIAEFEKISETRFLKVRNAGIRSLNELKWFMKSRDLKLKS